MSASIPENVEQQSTLSEQLSLFRERLPRRPYCTDDLAAGLLIRARVQALQHAYIQPNPPCLLFWLVFDVDRAGAGLAWELAELPPPSWIALNPENGHAHVAYGIRVPICLTDAGRPEVARYAAAVDLAYLAALAADESYGRLICKNPCHPHWRVWLPAGDVRLYDLGELAEYVDLAVYRDRRRHLPGIGLGRNCTLFDRLRHWAYRAINDHRGGPWEPWIRLILAKAEGYNDFRVPLPHSEVKATAKSVGKYVWRIAPLSAARFSAKQAARGRRSVEVRQAVQGELFAAHMAELGRRSGEARWVVAADRRDLARELRAQGKSLREIAQELGVDPETVRRWTR